MKQLLTILFTFIFFSKGFAQLELPYPVKVVNPRSLDYKYLYQGNRPYADTAEVNATIPLGIRHKGLIVNVNNSLWWYKDSVLNNSLVPLSLGGGISKTYANYGLQNVNDSTLKVDSSLIATRAGLYKVSDSISDKFNNYLPLTGGNITGNVGFNVPSPTTKLDINGRIKLRQYGETAGIWFSDSSSSNKVFMGVRDNADSAFGIWYGGRWLFTLRNDSSSSSGSNGYYSRIEHTGSIAVLDSAKTNTVVWAKRNTTYGNTAIMSLQNLNSVRADSMIVRNGTASQFLKANGSVDNNSYLTLNTAQTITGAKTVTNNFKIKDDNGTAISNTKLVLENARTATISDTIAVAPYILFSSKTFVSDASGDYSGQSNNMEWRIRQTLAKAGYGAGQDNRLYFDYKNGNAGSWISAVSISKDGVQGNITGVDQMTLGNYSGNAGKITFKNFGGFTAGSIQAAGNVLLVGDGGYGRISFFNGVVYYGGSATSTGSQLSNNGWAFAKNANSTFTASALLHLDKNRSTAGNAPIKFTLDGAALLTTPERGALEAMPYRLHFTDSSNQRNTLAYLSDVYKTPMNVADSNYTVVGNEIIIGFTGLTADRACTLPNPASHVGKSLTLFAKGMNNYDLNFSSSYKPKNLNDAIITSVKGDLPKHGVDTGSAIEGVSMKLVSFNNEWVILNYFTHYK